MNKEKLLEYVQSLKKEAASIDQNAQNRIKQELEAKGKFTYSFTLGEHLYALNKRLNTIVLELENIIKNEEF